MVVETSVELEGNQTPTVCSISYIRVWAYIGTFSDFPCMFVHDGSQGLDFVIYP